MKTLIKQVFTKVADRVKQVYKNYKDRHQDKQAQPPKQQETVEPKNQLSQENEAARMERAKASAQEVKEKLKEMDIKQVQDVKGHDGSIPQGGTSTSTGNSSGTYNSPKEPPVTYRGKSQGKGLEL